MGCCSVEQVGLLALLETAFSCSKSAPNASRAIGRWQSGIDLVGTFTEEFVFDLIPLARPYRKYVREVSKAYINESVRAL